MLKKSKSATMTVWAEYLFVFGVLCVTFFFMIPQSDIFLFARDTQANFLSVLDNALNYGNGRLVGNILGMGLSKLFEIAFAVVAVGLTVLTALVNKLVFNNNKYTIIPLQL